MISPTGEAVLRGNAREIRGLSCGVMSLWTGAQDDRVGTRPPNATALMDPWLWSLSALLARRQFPELRLFTDSVGAKFLIDELGIPFDCVSLELEALKPSPFWSFGKLRAYESMDVPFIHIDADVFLFKPLPERMLNSVAVAERKEVFGGYAVCYPFYYYYPVREFFGLCSGYMPMQWVKNAGISYAYNAGLLGGNDLGRIHRYAGTSRLIYEQNPQLVEKMAGTQLSVMLEQLGFAMEFEHRVETLLSENPSSEECAEVGYTHLIGNSKRASFFRAKVRARLMSEFPVQAEMLTRKGL